MSQVIIYKSDDGTIAVVSPSVKSLQNYSIEVIAKRSVPAGKHFRIISASDLPDAPQEAWEVNDADLNDGIGERQA